MHYYIIKKDNKEIGICKLGKDKPMDDKYFKYVEISKEEYEKKSKKNYK